MVNALLRYGTVDSHSHPNAPLASLVYIPPSVCPISSVFHSHPQGTAPPPARNRRVRFGFDSAVLLHQAAPGSIHHFINLLYEAETRHRDRGGGGGQGAARKTQLNTRAHDITGEVTVPYMSRVRGGETDRFRISLPAPHSQRRQRPPGRIPPRHPHRHPLASRTGKSLEKKKEEEEEETLDFQGARTSMDTSLSAEDEERMGMTIVPRLKHESGRRRATSTRGVKITQRTRPPMHSMRMGGMGGRGRGSGTGLGTRNVGRSLAFAWILTPCGCCILEGSGRLPVPRPSSSTEHLAIGGRVVWCTDQETGLQSRAPERNRCRLDLARLGTDLLASRKPEGVQAGTPRNATPHYTADYDALWRGDLLVVSRGWFPFDDAEPAKKVNTRLQESLAGGEYTPVGPPRGRGGDGTGEVNEQSMGREPRQE
ncbi:unnamed protein product [Diplocarpon coronariae]